MHLWFIFGIFAIPLETAHTALVSHYKYIIVLLFNMQLRGGTCLIQLHFHNLQFRVEHCAFLVLTRKSDWMKQGTPLHNAHNPGSATEENQWGQALISLQSANAVSSETLCLGFCYSSHSMAHVFKASSYHAAALQILLSSSYTCIKIMSSGRKQNSAQPHFSFCVCSRLSKIAFTSVTFHYVIMSLGGENSCRKVKVWITLGKYYLQLGWIWCLTGLLGQFVSLFVWKKSIWLRNYPEGLL